MLEREARAVRLGAFARDREDAIRQVGALLAGNGHVLPGYAESMLRREALGGTYVGNGVAIPHGLRDDAHLVLETGVAGIQFPAGVEWAPRERAFLVFAIAARDERHVAFLSRLTDVALHAETAGRLAKATEAGEFLRLLNLEDAARRAATAERSAGFTHQRELVILGMHGLHARPASVFASIARKFDAEVQVYHGERCANGKSVAALIALGAQSGAVLRLMARGNDGELALAALCDAIGAGLDGREAFASPFLTVATPMAASQASGPMDGAYAGPTLSGIAAAPGIAIGTAQPMDTEAPPDCPIDGQGCDSETVRLNEALAVALRQIQELHGEVFAQFGPDQAGIIEAQAELLTDPGLAADAMAHMVAGRSAEWAWRDVTRSAAAEIAALPDPILAARAADIEDMAARVLRVLAGGGVRTVAARFPSTIVVADDLCPSETAGLDRQRVAAIVTARGGPNSHTAILARALGIPAVVAIGDATATIGDGTTIIVDGDRGRVVVRPTIRDLSVAEHHRTDYNAALAASLALAYQPAFTRDGLRMGVVASIDRAGEAGEAVEAGAEGVGLARTETLFADHPRLPSEDEQRAVYTDMVRAMNGLPLSIRALDLGSDRRRTEFAVPAEPNPFLGERGVRLAFARPDLFAVQARALAAAAVEGPVRVLLPMVSSLAEFRKARAMIDKACVGARSPDLSVGVMIEVPAAAILAERLAAEADFLLIGADDLTQYVLAIDRQHPRLAHLADDHHPAVLRLIEVVARAARASGKRIGVCGTLASNARATPLLVGLGVDELSATISGVPLVKQRVRELDAGLCRAVLSRALDCAEADEVRALLWSEGL